MTKQEERVELVKKIHKTMVGHGDDFLFLVDMSHDVADAILKDYVPLSALKEVVEALEECVELMRDLPPDNIDEQAAIEKAEQSITRAKKWLGDKNV